MQRLKGVFGSALAGFAVWAILNICPVQADEQYVPKADVEILYQAPLDGLEQKEVTVRHVSAPPDFVGVWHYHTGPVFVYVLKGELTVESESGTETVKVGEIYAEPINNAMLPRNLSKSDDLEFLVFQVGNIGEPPMVKAE